MDLGLDGKRVIVTGASRGIGLAATRAFVDAGASVIAAARTVSPELGRLTAGGRVRAVTVDLATPAGPRELLATAVEAGPVDVLVNNAGGVTPRPGGFLSVSDDDWLASFTLTCLAAVRVTRAALPGMLERGEGTIVSTCSVNARLPDPVVIDYGAAKAALLNFSKALSKEVGPHGIRVNTVSPGPVETPLWLGGGGVAERLGAALAKDPGDIAAQAVAETATGRFTTASEVADLIVLLAGSRAGNLTGADVVIDGGLVATI